MTTGKINYSPDYKSEKPKLPKDFGLMRIVCADGQHRFLPDAPKCGCRAVINSEAERSRLEREVIKAATAWRRTVISTAPEDLQARARSTLYDAVKRLEEFETGKGWL